MQLKLDPLLTILKALLNKLSIKIAQSNDPQLQKIRDLIKLGSQSEFCIHEDGSLRFGNRLCVPNDSEDRKSVV